MEEVKFEIFNIFENNIISIELAKVLGYVSVNEFSFAWHLDQCKSMNHEKNCQYGCQWMNRRFPKFWKSFSGWQAKEAQCHAMGKSTLGCNTTN